VPHPLLAGHPYGTAAHSPFSFRQQSSSKPHTGITAASQDPLI
jgi:hypothetical protein